MENSRWLGLVTVGLIIAALAVAYFLLTGKFAVNNTKQAQVSPAPTVLGQNVQVSPQPDGSSREVGGATSAPLSAYNRITARNQTQNLPKTGFPISLATIFSVSAITIGWGLCKYPK